MIKEHECELEQIGTGVSANVYEYTENSVLMFTPVWTKVRYFYHIGIVINYHGYYYTTERYTQIRTRMYVLELVKLVPEDNGSSTAARQAREQGYALNYQKAQHINPASYPLYADSLEFVKSTPKLRNKKLDTDVHSGNFMYCPLTQTVIPIDLVNFDYMERD